VFVLLEMLFAMGLAELVVLTVGLSPEQRTVVLMDFEKARQYLTHYMHIKLGHWQRCPFIFVGMAHWCLETARRFCMDGFAIGASLLLDCPEKVDRLTRILCTPGSILCEQLKVFMRGGAMGPHLKRLRARWKFMRCVERLIEAEHGRIKKGYLARSSHFQCI
jgi:hypothetical protein